MPFDPAETLGEDDPLRAWAAEHLDPVTGALLVTDPAKAIDDMVRRGIPPPASPSTPGLAYSDPGGGFGADPSGELPVFGPGGKMQGNLTSGQGQPPTAVPPLATPPSVVAPAAPSSAFDPTPEVPSSVPLPRPRPAEAGPGASELSSSKKPSASDALSDFSKSLAGVRPVAPPALNPVGTPSVRSPTAAGAPNIQALLQMIGQQNQATPLSTLGRLLVAGKA
jgi:hypothetical protein